LQRATQIYFPFPHALPQFFRMPTGFSQACRRIGLCKTGINKSAASLLLLFHNSASGQATAIFMTDLPAQQKLIAALRNPHCYDHYAKTVRVVETHISWVLLAGRYAYKIKKAVDLEFLDFTGLEARRFYCNEEVRLNRRLAPQIYLGVIPIGGSHDHPGMGAGPPIEYAVKMRRFASGKLLARLLALDRVTPQHMDSLAALLARFHRSLPPVEAGSVFGSAASIRAAAMQNFEQLRPLLHDETYRNLLSATECSASAEFTRCANIFEQRRAQGWVRECHGDLHLGNIVLVGDEPVPFDGIEFNPALRWLDVMDEASFLLMDLLHHGRTALAYRFLNAYLEITGDYAGMDVLRFYLAYRAMVRAKVSAIRANQPKQTKRLRQAGMNDCRSYLSQAAQSLEQRRPALIIMHGLPGSGKTTFAQAALERLGAIRIRSDVERKRLFGLDVMDDSHSQSGAGIYGADATQRTYARLLELAQRILAAGFPVIVDAAFLRHAERVQFRELAHKLGTPFAIASIRASGPVLHARLELRHASARDASEANAEVLQLLQSVQEPLTDEELGCTVQFSNEASDSGFDLSQGWDRLHELVVQH
jgi:uncharacterized protein